MGKNRAKPRHNAQPELPIPVLPGAEESPVRLHRRQEQLHRAEVRLNALEQRLLAAEERIDEKIRTANSLVKALANLEKEANETVIALSGAIKFLAAENVAEVIQEEVAIGIKEMHDKLREAGTAKAQQIIDEYDRLREIMLHVRDRQGKKMPPGSPTLRDMVAGLALEAVQREGG